MPQLGSSVLSFCSHTKVEAEEDEVERQSAQQCTLPAEQGQKSPFQGGLAQRSRPQETGRSKHFHRATGRRGSRSSHPALLTTSTNSSSRHMPSHLKKGSRASHGSRRPEGQCSERRLGAESQSLKKGQKAPRVRCQLEGGGGPGT